MNTTFYKYSTASGGLKTLNGTLKFDKPENFNDPFDCFPVVARHSPTDPRIIKLTRKKGIPLEVLNKKTEEELTAGAKALYEAERREVRVLCLTKNKHNLLMWAHYADHHKGMCLKFDFKHMMETGAKSANYFEDPWAAFPVDYEHKRPQVHLLKKRGMESSILTKSHHWKYEKEWRVVKRFINAKPDDKEKLINYNVKECVKAVYLGCNITPEDEAKTISKIKEINSEFQTEIQIYKARISSKYYIIEFDKIDLN